MVLCICTNFHEYILNGFRDVNHKSTSLMVVNLFNYIFKQKKKTSKDKIVLKFRM